MYFQNCTTVNEIKEQYRKLCFQHHPDIGGDVETMKLVNLAYHEALAAAHGQSSKGTDKKDHTYYYNQEVEQVIIDKINELIGLQMQDVEILLVGTWIWVQGDTKPYKKKLGKGTKENPGLGLGWNNKRQKWFWSPPGSRKRRYNSKADFSDLCETYGVSNQTGKPQAKVNRAVLA